MSEDDFSMDSLKKRTKEIDSLRKDGINLEETDPLLKYNLAEPQRGEEVVGELIHEEACIYAQCLSLKEELQRLTRDINADGLVGIAEKIRAGSDVVEVSTSNLNINNSKLNQYFRLTRQYGHYYEMLWWKVGERLDMHQYSLGIRSRNRVISKGLKYEIKD